MSGPSPRQPAPASSSRAVLTARSLLLDAVAAEVWSALRDAGVRSILLKGASIAAWLYDDGSPRPYGDVDLLVAPEHKDRAEEVLARLGFTSPHAVRLPPDAYRARSWYRHDGTVDLHHRASMDVGVPDDAAWSLLSGSAVPLRVGGFELEVLGPAARTLLVVLHAAVHGPTEPKPLEDLTRALVKVPEATWREAAQLAAALRAERAMSGGLALVPGGVTLARRLGLPEDPSLVLALSHAGDRLTALVSVTRRPPGGRVKLMARILFPPPEYVRQRYLRGWPGPAQGPLGLALAYVWQLGRGVPELARAVGRFTVARRSAPRRAILVERLDQEHHARLE